MAYYLKNYDLIQYQEDAMTQHQDTSISRVMHNVCCGLDVHNKLINACLITTDENGQEDSQLKVFQTFTDDLYQFSF